MKKHMPICTTPILTNYDGYLTTKKAERKTYDGKPLFVVCSRQYLRRNNLPSYDSLEFRHKLIKYNKSFPAKNTVVTNRRKLTYLPNQRQKINENELVSFSS